MKKLSQFRGEAWLVVVGLILPFLLFVLYLWGVSGLASTLDKASNTNAAMVVPKTEFNLKGAQEILRTRGLLQ